MASSTFFAMTTTLASKISGLVTTVRPAGDAAKARIISRAMAAYTASLKRECQTPLMQYCSMSSRTVHCSGLSLVMSMRCTRGSTSDVLFCV